MLIVLLTLALAQMPAAKPAADAIDVSQPVQLTELDMGKLKGEPWRLSWSPDATELYIQTAERDGAGALKKAWHYVLSASGGAPTKLDAEPAWAAKYWTWKSTQAAPGSPAFKITVEERREIARATDRGRGGELAGMGGDISGAAVGGGPGAGAGAAGVMGIGEGQNVTIRAMRVKGEVIGEWVNAGIVPGLTFSWSPAALDMIAFSKRDKNVVIMDQQGRKKEIETRKTTRLPAWSDDGKRLAFLEQTDRKKYVLHVVAIR